MSHGARQAPTAGTDGGGDGYLVITCAAELETTWVHQLAGGSAARCAWTAASSDTRRTRSSARAAARRCTARHTTASASSATPPAAQRRCIIGCSLTTRFVS
jgi:hypothetical protein